MEPETVNKTLIIFGKGTTCRQGLILPLFPYEDYWEPGVRAFIYLIALLYAFLGMGIVADVFMTAIEKITSKKKHTLTIGESEEMELVEVRVWNDTVANLTLMAFGSSAPEILLTCIETVGNGFEAGELGPGSIIGSAAFNFLVITAVCIVAIPKGQIRKIANLKVVLVTSGFSLLAYLWMLFILKVSSPEVVNVWEALVTFAFFPLLVFTAWWADKGWVICSQGEAHSHIPTDYPNHHPIQMDEASPEQEDLESNLFTKYGKVNKEALIQIYKKFRKFPGLSDKEAAVLTAKKLIDSQSHSILWYRIGALRSLTGAKRNEPILRDKLKEVYEMINSSPEVPNIGRLPTQLPCDQAIVEFRTATFAVSENVGEFNVSVVRHGRMDNTCHVRVESFDGRAKANKDYYPIHKTITFAPFVHEKEVAVKIIDDNQWEPDAEFFLRLCIDSDASQDSEVILGRLPVMDILILNDDTPGVISLRKRGILVKESYNFASVKVERINGTDGEVSVKWRTIDHTAKSPRDYQGGEGTLTFKHGESLRCISIPITNDLKPEKDECFEIEIFHPEGGAQLGPIQKMAVTITNDDAFNSEVQRMLWMTNHNMKLVDDSDDPVSSWKSQFQGAFAVNGGDLENATSFDYFMHFLTFGWKVIFALIPPPCMFGGWLCFFCSLGAIGLVTAVVGDLAGIFGCLIGLKDSVTAITFVALGTSLPDLFASRTAARHEKRADSAIGNITGSTAVNVFVGLGLPWLLSAVYHQAVLGDEFKVESGALTFSVLVFTVVASIAILLIILRRCFFLFGKAELGGPTRAKYFSGVFLIALWFIYMIFTSLQAYNYIPDLG